MILYLLTTTIIIYIFYIFRAGDLIKPLFDKYYWDKDKKGQGIRLIDVFILGPIGLYIGYKMLTGRASELSPLLGLFVIGYGIGTIVFNGIAYSRIKDQKSVSSSTNGDVSALNG